MVEGKVIFVDAVHNVLWKRLSELGWECVDRTKDSAETIKSELHVYSGIVIRSKFKLDASLLEQLPKLQFIARSGSGLEHIDTDYAKKNNIHVFSSPEGNRDALAEHAMGMLLMLLNNLKKADTEVREGFWLRAENRGFELKGKTIGLIGYGKMAQALSKRLKGFEVNTIAYDKFKTGFSNHLVTEVSKEDLQRKADIISVHTNFLPENKYIINEEFIKGCKKDFILINTARGFNVHTLHLIDALKSGKIKGACLDVLEYESVSFENVYSKQGKALERLKQFKNVILSPHIAGWSHESYFKLSNVLADKIESWLTSKKSTN
ncbi:MAG: hydroxyacid dehydrogenase [Flavobacteriales bacterium]|nr:hydroxyacid dehydrogenase [Flavobacteriales bacterium]|tara:strand:- start:27086 stop:28048 length:963 start_codon:yes stop_codon:yes gene_type:complete